VKIELDEIWFQVYGPWQVTWPVPNAQPVGLRTL